MIDEFKYGFFRVDKKEHYGDIKILNDRVKQWSNRERFTLRREDILDLMTAKPEILVIGTGATGLLKVSDELQMELRQLGIKAHIEKTVKACELYNKLRKERKNVHALLCATC